MYYKLLKFENVLSVLKVVHRYKDHAQCCCPFHDDKKASLTVSIGEKGIVLKCHAGCEVKDILAAVGLEMKDLFFCEEQTAESWRDYVERRESKKIEAVYNYHSFNGEYVFTKLRLTGKKIIYGTLKNERFIYGLQGRKRKELKAIFGNVNEIRQAIEACEPIFIVEGEKDVQTLNKQGYASFTYGGVSDWQQDFAELVQGAEVYILADNDTAGVKVAKQVLSDIKGIAKTARIIVPTPSIPKGDISDYFEEGHTKEDFEQLLEAEDVAEESQREQAEDDFLVTKLFEIDAFNHYRTSDAELGRLYADIFRNKHRYNPTQKDFMLYDGRRWIMDTEGMSARSDAKKLSAALITYASKVAQNDEDKIFYLKSVMPLTQLRNRNNMLADCRDVHYFTNEELDTNDFLLNVQNGVLDLSGNDVVFINHDPDLLLSKICNVSYDPAATCEVWSKFLEDIMQGDHDKIRYLQKIAGLSLTGNTSEETCFILYGSTTRNGKSTFCETLIYLLGDYALTMKPETLAVKQNLDSRQASGDIARLAGCRFCNASEPPKRMLFDTALLKSLLGRDSITARHLHQREFSFVPKFKLVINTNYLPTITDDTVFSSGRINIISFDRHFEPAEQDKALKGRLRNDQELSGILNWCIEGLRLYREEGLVPPAAVRQATQAYRSDSDKLGNFINECLVPDKNVNTKAKDVYDLYSEWCDENGFGCENKSNFFSELKNKNIFATSGTVNGMTVKNIVKGYKIDADFQKAPPGITPFN